VDNKIQVRVEEDRRAASIHPGEVLGHSTSAQQARCQIVLSLFAVVWEGYDSKFAGGCLSP
jgi:hypothetical protein